MLSSGLFLLLTLSEEQFALWGWRIPFLLSIVLVGIGLYVRATIAKTPVFRRAMETQTRARTPFLDIVRAYPTVLALTSGGIMPADVLFYTITTFSLAYGTTELGLSRSTML